MPTHQNRQNRKKKIAFLEIGFRPFFTVAALSAVLLMAFWLSYLNDLPVLPKLQIPSSMALHEWHAHEMIFGFGLAVVSGFLLTAVRNWTGLQTATGRPLLGLVVLWLCARVLYFLPQYGIVAAALGEALFIIGLTVAISLPIIKARQWHQLAIVGKLLLFLPASVLFHLNSSAAPYATRLGLIAGLYLLLAIVLTLARRVLPMFIERGIQNGFVPKNHPWLDRASLFLFLAFSVTDALLYAQILDSVALQITTAVLAAMLTLIHGKRLYGWYHPAIWRKPLVWVLVLAYLFLVLGFFLKGLASLSFVNPSLALHAFTVGGIGLMTLGMMARVSLGHTGRNINAPPTGLALIFGLLVAAAVVRVGVIGCWPESYSISILISQLFWICAYGGFLVIFLPFLIFESQSNQPIVSAGTRPVVRR